MSTPQRAYPATAAPPGLYINPHALPYDPPLLIELDARALALSDQAEAAASDGRRMLADELRAQVAELQAAAEPLRVGARFRALYARLEVLGDGWETAGADIIAELRILDQLYPAP